MENPLNFYCPFCTHRTLDDNKDLACGLYGNRKIKNMHTDNCQDFTAKAEGLRRQRWQIIKLLLILFGFFALISLVLAPLFQ